MKAKGTGGGNTITGLNFEKERDILEILKKSKNYSLRGNVIYFRGKEVARSYRKQGLYRLLAEKKLIGKN